MCVSEPDFILNDDKQIILVGLSSRFVSLDNTMPTARLRSTMRNIAAFVYLSTFFITIFDGMHIVSHLIPGQHVDPEDVCRPCVCQENGGEILCKTRERSTGGSCASAGTQALTVTFLHDEVPTDRANRNATYLSCAAPKDALTLCCICLATI